MRLISGLFFTLVLLAAVGAVIVYSGTYNVAATEPHTAVGAWVLETTKQRSVATRAAAMDPPAAFSDDQIRQGFAHYQAMCVICHGAPGIERSELARGLLPEAPPLDEVATEWSAAEMFWVVKHGIRMTGMPAWGPTHSDEQLWAIVAFMQRLPALSADEYQQWQTDLGDAADHHHH